ncbi:hypothetical protein K435DRAFT_805074 [Dendrothele bispora CBS 962.96]|uniref:Uncharacterized protein n=1 Tax=Dendrothele bispora (strain CBS 962.96) TaxID=1314807 RepID=A0A4S8LCR2_DENBC|nr:hypothetical protein K435DRAFT_805074 [Dendrothele bispora CBS 962.96]
METENPTNISHFQEEPKMVAADHRDNVDDVCDKSSPTSIFMPLTQTQTSLPLSDSDLLVLKQWVFEMALGFLLLGVQYVIGDIVVVWRAWVLFPQGLAVKVTLSICLLGSFAGTSLEIGLVAKGLMKNYVKAAGSKTNTMILTVPLIFTNLTATTLIGFKAWNHFQSIQRNLGSTKRSPKSGLLYLAFWVISAIGYLVLGLTHDSGTTANQVYLVIMPGLVAIYPILILLAVAHENNKAESVNDMSLSQSIRFASVQASKSEDHHPEPGGESQLAFPAASINNSVRAEGDEIEVVPRLS